VILLICVLVMHVKENYPIIFYLFLLLFAYCMYVMIKDMF
jgi:hypothetical protein